MRYEEFDKNPKETKKPTKKIVFEELQKEARTKKELAEICNRTEERIQQILSEYIKKGLVYFIKEGKKNVYGLKRDLRESGDE